MLLVLDLEQGLLSLLELLGAGGGDTEVPVEVIVIDEVWPNGLEVHEHIIELLEDEEALSHALSTWDGVTLTWGGAHHLEEVLSDSQVLLLLRVLPDHGMDHSLEDVLLGHYALHVLNQVVSVVDLIVLQIVDDEVESGLWDHIDEWWEDLESILSASEHHKVVSEKIVILEHIASSA